MTGYVEQQPNEYAIITATAVLEDAGEHITPRVVEAYRVLAKAFPPSYLRSLPRACSFSRIWPRATAPKSSST